MSHKKGAYVDGHERPDVIAYRTDYMKKLDEVCSIHLPPPPCSDERAATPCHLLMLKQGKSLS